MFNFEELFIENKDNKKDKKIKIKTIKKSKKVAKKLPKRTKSFVQYGGVFENSENKIKIENIKKDWYAIDYVFFNEEVIEDKFGKEFTKNWNAIKKDVLQKFYEITDYVSLYSTNNDILTEGVKKSKTNAKTKAKKIAKKAKKMAKKTIAKKQKKIKTIAKKLAETVFYPSLLNEEKAVKNAIKCIICAESAMHLFGGMSSLVSPLIKYYAIYLKKY